MLNCKGSAVLLILMLVCVMATPVASDMIVSDGEFLEESWMHDLFAEVPSGGATITLDRTETGGNPGAAQMGFQDFPFTAFANGHLHVAATYDPSSSGAVTNVLFSIHFATIDGSGNCGNPSNPSVGAGVVLRQQGSYFMSYHAYSIVAKESGWVTISDDYLAEQDFVRWNPDFTVSPDVHPDFSETGALLEFGYVTAGNTGQPECYREWRADNFYIQLDTWTGVSEPETEVHWGMLKSLYRR